MVGKSVNIPANDWFVFTGPNGALDAKKIHDYREYVLGTPQGRSVAPHLEAVLQYMNTALGVDAGHIYPEHLPLHLRFCPVAPNHMSKAEDEDFTSLFHNDDDAGIQSAFSRGDFADQVDHKNHQNKLKETMYALAYDPDARASFIRHLVRNPNSDVLKYVMSHMGANAFKALSNDYSRMTGGDLRDHVASRILPHASADSNYGPILEDILAHNSEDPHRVLAGLRGAPSVENTSILGTLANTVYKEEPHKMFEDFKIPSRVLDTLPAHAQVGYLVHKLKSQQDPESNVVRVAEKLQDSMGKDRFGAMLNQQMDKHGISRMNPVFQKLQNSSVGNSIPSVLSVKTGSAVLRKLRDYIKSMGKDLLPNELPLGQKWNSITRPVTDRNGNVTHIADWNPLRERDGKISAAKVQQYIDQMQGTDYHFEIAPYEISDQKHSAAKKQMVFRLKVSPADMEKLRASGADETLKQLTDLGMQSRHPVSDGTIGWLRFDVGHDGHVFIDEVQSDLETDFEGSLRKQIRDAFGSEDEDTIRPYRERMHRMFPPVNIQKIKDVVFRGRPAAEIVHEAFQEHARRSGMAGSKWNTHTSQTKGPIASMDMSQPLPKGMKVNYDDAPKTLGATPQRYGTLQVEQDPSYDHLSNAKVHGDELRLSEKEKV